MTFNKVVDTNNLKSKKSFETTKIGQFRQRIHKLNNGNSQIMKTAKLGEDKNVLEAPRNYSADTEQEHAIETTRDGLSK